VSFARVWRRWRDRRGPTPSAEVLAALRDAEAMHAEAARQIAAQRHLTAQMAEHTAHNHYAEAIAHTFRGVSGGA
jgi:hypothetical protein